MPPPSRESHTLRRRRGFNDTLGTRVVTHSPVVQLDELLRFLVLAVRLQPEGLRVQLEDLFEVVAGAVLEERGRILGGGHSGVASSPHVAVGGAGGGRAGRARRSDVSDGLAALLLATAAGAFPRQRNAALPALRRRRSNLTRLSDAGKTTARRNYRRRSAKRAQKRRSVLGFLMEWGFAR